MPSSVGGKLISVERQRDEYFAIQQLQFSEF